MKNCQICNEEINFTSAGKYCKECAILVNKQIKKKAYTNFKKKQARKRHEADYKKPVNEIISRLDRKSYWDKRDTSCDGSAYF